jgi:hypothetical protein
MKRTTIRCVLLPAVILAVASLLFILPIGQAQDTRSGYAWSIPQPEKRGAVESVAARDRTVEKMAASDAQLARLGQLPIPGLHRTRPLLTPMGPAAYRALKARFAAVPVWAKPERMEPLGTTPILGRNLEGVNQTEAGNWQPPDTHAAPGPSHVVEVTNLHVDIYSRAGTPPTRWQYTLGSFFGYAYPNDMTDPRVLYDHVWKRFVVVAVNIPPAADPRTLIFLAVSKSSNPTGAWWIYHVDMGPVAGNPDGYWIWDYPMVGMDQDGIIITGNLFKWTPGVGGGSFISTDCIALAKARLYNGGAFKTVWWTGLHWSPQPPVVLPPSDPALMKNATHLVSADPYADKTKLFIHTLKDSAYPATQTLSTSEITVTAYDIPPDAPQPGTTATLDTLDARFLSNSIQIFDHTDGGSDRIFQAHTVKYGSYAMPRFYHLKIPTLSVMESRSFWASGSSHDFNASIAANNSKDMFVTWSSTDPGAGTQAQIRVSGKLAGELDISAGHILKQSPTYYTGGRWGDHTSVHIDHNSITMKRAWICNQYILGDHTWGTRIGAIYFP